MDNRSDEEKEKAYQEFMKTELAKPMEQFILEGLHTDGGHHKQWYLEMILRRISSRYDELKSLSGWEDGI